jgi:hypothetical protein
MSNNTNNNHRNHSNESDPIVRLQSPKYAIDDKVYCSSDTEDDHENNNNAKKAYYKAIIRQARYRGSWEYLVHFVGWNNRFDVWKPERSLFQKKEDCIEVSNHKMKRTNKEEEEEEEEEDGTLSSASRPWKKKKKKQVRRDDDDDNTEDDEEDDETTTTITATRRAVVFFQEYCELPFTLKTVLIDEYNSITQHNMLQVIPAPVPIRKLLQFFQNKKIKAIQQQQQQAENTLLPNETMTATLEDIREFTRGITELFRTALPICLLYPEERWQYEQQQMIHTNTNMPLEEMYGCEYLLRLYVRLPILLQPAITAQHPQYNHKNRAATPTQPNNPLPFQNPKKLAIYGKLLAELLVLMQKNRHALFSSSVRPATNANYYYHCGDSSPTSQPQQPNHSSPTGSPMAMETATPTATMDTTQ